MDNDLNTILACIKAGKSEAQTAEKMYSSVAGVKRDLAYLGLSYRSLKRSYQMIVFEKKYDRPTSDKSRRNKLSRYLFGCSFSDYIRKGDRKMIEKEKEKYELIEKMAGCSEPLKKSQLTKNEILQIAELRQQGVKVLSSPGPKGGYYMSSDKNNVANHINWVNNWRSSMGIPAVYSL